MALGRDCFLAPSVRCFPGRGKSHTSLLLGGTRTYNRPASFFGGLDVPQVLAQRDHGAVARWRAEQQPANAPVRRQARSLLARWQAQKHALNLGS